MAWFHFNTAPKIMSEKVVQLVKAGKTDSLLQAIHNERDSKEHTIGQSKDGSVKVRRIGSYSPAVTGS
jgi:hypothetical protein